MAKINVEASVAEKVRSFAAAEGIVLEVVSDASCAVSVAPRDERRQCDLKTIYCSGWIACETARALAGEIGISIGEMGKLLDHLDVKIRNCTLGCF